MIQTLLESPPPTVSKGIVIIIPAVKYTSVEYFSTEFATFIDHCLHKHVSLFILVFIQLLKLLHIGKGAIAS